MAHWFKFYGSDYLSDPKRLALSPTRQAMWVTLLCIASTTENGEIENLTEERLKIFTGIVPSENEWKETDGVLKQFETLKMIEIGAGKEAGKITVLNFKKRQGMNLTGYERVKRYREKQGSVINDNMSDNTKDNSRIEKNREEIGPAKSLSLQPDIEEIIKSYSENIKHPGRITDNAIKVIEKRLKDFSKEDLILCVTRKSNDNWFMQNNTWRGITWFFESPKRLNKYLEESDD